MATRDRGMPGPPQVVSKLDDRTAGQLSSSKTLKSDGDASGNRVLGDVIRPSNEAWRTIPSPQLKTHVPRAVARALKDPSILENAC